jgi:hypothetical protein
MNRKLSLTTISVISLALASFWTASPRVFANASLPADREGDAMLSPEQAWSSTQADDKPTETYLQMVDGAKSNAGKAAQARSITGQLHDEGHAAAAAKTWAGRVGRNVAYAAVPLGVVLLFAAVWWLRQRRRDTAPPALAMSLLAQPQRGAQRQAVKSKAASPRRRAA